MKAGHFPFFIRQRSQKLEIRESQSAVKQKRVSDAARAVSSGARTYILIESLNRCPWCRKNQPNSISSNQLIVSEMRDDFSNRPFRWSRTMVGLFDGKIFHQRFENVRCFSLEIQRVSASLVT